MARMRNGAGNGDVYSSLSLEGGFSLLHEGQGPLDGIFRLEHGCGEVDLVLVRLLEGHAQAFDRRPLDGAHRHRHDHSHI